MPISTVRIPIMQKASFDTLKDFSYIMMLTSYTFGVTTKADGPFKTWADVIKYAKENPGKVSYATPGAGTSLHIGMEMIAAKEGVKFTQVPFKGGAETNASVLGGHTMLQADSTGWRPLVEAGQLRVRAAEKSLSAARSARYPRLLLSGNWNTNFSTSNQKVTGYTFGTPYIYPSGFTSTGEIGRAHV